MPTRPLYADPQGRNAWGWVLAAGLVLLVGGICAIAAPGFTLVAIAALIGWVLLIAGIAGIVMGFRARTVHRRHTDLLYGVVSFLLGLFVLFDPVAGAATLTLMVIVWLALRAVIEIGGAIRAGSGSHRIGLWVVGVVDALLAILLIAYYPVGAIQTLGVFVGLSLLMGGIVTIVAAFGLRRLQTG